MILDLIVLILGAILLIIAGAVSLLSYNNLKPPGTTTVIDSNTASARSFMLWTGIICLVGLFFIIVLVVLTIVFRNKLSTGKTKWIMLGLILLTMLIIFISGILAAVGATRIRNIPNKTPKISTAYNMAIGAAVTLLVGMTILFIIYVVIFIIRRPNPLVLANQQLQKARQEALKMLPQPVQKAVTPYIPPTLLPKRVEAPVVVEQGLTEAYNPSPDREVAPPRPVYRSAPPVIERSAPIYQPPPQPVYETPAPQPVYQAPAPQPVYQAPAPQPVYQAPAAQPVYQAPAPAPIAQPVVQPVAQPVAPSLPVPQPIAPAGPASSSSGGFFNSLARGAGSLAGDLARTGAAVGGQIALQRYGGGQL